MVTLDIGGGTNPYQNKNEEIIHMDYYAKGDNYLKHDAENIPYPFEENSFDKIYASHILEHLQNLWMERNKPCVLDELWRVIKSGGLIIRMPHPSVCYNWAHPTHKRTASVNSFSFVLPNSKERYSVKSWIIIKKQLRYTRLGFFGKLINKIFNRSEKMQYLGERFFCYFVGGFDEVYFELTPYGK